MKKQSPRTKILRRIGDPVVADSVSPYSVSETLDRRYTSSELMRIFCAVWESMGGSWEIQDNPVTARLSLILFLRELGIDRVLSWQWDALPIPGLSEVFETYGIDVVPLDRRNLDPDLNAGITGVDAAIANTSTLVFSQDSRKSWLSALVPIRLIVLIPSSRLHFSIDTWREQWNQTGREDLLPHTLLMTGPSVSEDIGLHRHLGMFGPRNMHAFLFDDSMEKSQLS